MCATELAAFNAGISARLSAFHRRGIGLFHCLSAFLSATGGCEVKTLLVADTGRVHDASCRGVSNPTLPLRSVLRVWRPVSSGW